MSAQINQQLSTVSRQLEELRSVERIIQEQIAEKVVQVSALQEQVANLQEPIVAPKKWHCGTGGDKTGRLNHETASEHSSCYIGYCTPDFINSKGKPSPKRCEMFETFREEANAGDIIFLHHKKVTHWGKYTG